MKTNNISKALTGEELLAAMSTIKEQRKPIAEGFLYEQTILMMAADPGTGKSTVSTQVAVELSSGFPVFGLYKVPRPMKVLYIQTERSIIELIERLDVINKFIPINSNNLVITSEYQVLNLLNYDHLVALIECVKRDCPNVDVIFIDPIYCMVSGGLSKDEPASAFTKAMSLLQKETGATLWYNHHTVKATYSSNSGDKIEKADPFYGSQWLKAHITGSYYMKESKEGVSLIKKKDNYNLMPHQIDLEYDPESELCSVPMGKLGAMDRVKSFIKAREIDQKEFSFRDIQLQTGLCTRSIRECFVHSDIKESLISITSSHNKKLYKVKV